MCRAMVEAVADTAPDEDVVCFYENFA